MNHAPLPASLRREDRRFLTGAGRFTDDLAPAGAAHALVLRSPHPHARIARIDAAAARALPGVRAVLTAAEAAAGGLGPLPCAVPVRNRDGRPCFDPLRGLLAADRVRYVGEPVALVVAESLEAARDAAEAVEVDYLP
ncbi:MAG: xanthine dehydrogenase family protein molybdopterin-binding subunit, partial [Hyphomicrobiaceae bacterium]